MSMESRNVCGVAAPQITLAIPSPELIKQAMHLLLSCFLVVAHHQEKKTPISFVHHQEKTTISLLLLLFAKTEIMDSYLYYYAPLPSWQLFACL